MIEVVSVHIPKTAGTAFKAPLKAWFGGFQDDYTDQAPEQVIALARKSGNSVIHGHFHAAKYRELLPDAKFIAWVRNPADRVMSEYFHFRRVTPLPHASSLYRATHRGQIGLHEFAARPEIRNLQSRYVDDFADMFFVGTQESFLGDLRDLSMMLDKPFIDPGMRNVGHDPLYDEMRARPDLDKIRNALNAVNDVDYGLWRLACGIG